jgi:enamine deaminase RidA (YjgF/YER057c/UK114 family)
MFLHFAKKGIQRHAAVLRRLARLVPANHLTTPLASGSGAGCRTLSSSIERIGTSDPRMSKVVVHNDVVYTSGLVDLQSGEGIVEQTQNVLREVDELLAAAGTSKSELLTASIWLQNIEEDFAAMNEVWVDWMDPNNKPVRATVESPMARPDFLVEIQVTAAK